MAAIDPKYFDVTVYMYPTREAARAGMKVGGAGFLIGLLPTTMVPSAIGEERHGFHRYVVTNAHVQQNGCTVVRETDDGLTEIYETAPDDWVVSGEDDIAIVRLDEHLSNYVPSDMCLSEDCKIGEWELYPGDEVEFFSRFIALDGGQRNQPLLRTGTLAMLPSPDARVRINGRDQLSFLVESRSIGGASGSPVWVQLAQPRVRHFAKQYPPLADNWIPSDRMLLGCNCGHWPYWTQARSSKSDAAMLIPNNYIETNSGVAVIVPAWRILALLDHPKLVAQRVETGT